jgi:hypothetical protein
MAVYTKARSWPIITIHIEPSKKGKLEQMAQKKGMQLTTFCRMVLLDTVAKEEGVK